MKTNRIDLRTSDEDEKILQRAASKMGEKNVSKVILNSVKEYASTEQEDQPILFHINRKALRDLEVNFDYGKRQLQIIIDEYFKAVGSYPSIAEMTTWFGSSKRDFLVTKKELLRTGIINKLYLEQKKSYPKLMFGIDNVMLPDFDPLYEACGQLIFISEVGNIEMMCWQCYSIVVGMITLIPEAVELEKKRWRIYAISKEEKARLAAIKKLCAAMDGIKIDTPSQLNILGFVQYDDESGAYEPMEGYIKGYNK